MSQQENKPRRKTKQPDLPAPRIAGDQLVVVEPAADNRMDYDLEGLHKFLHEVFGDDALPKGAKPWLCIMQRDRDSGGWQKWMTAVQGEDPQTEFIHKLRRSPRARPLYYNTASFYPDAEGQISHKKDNFAALHVVVLDDIGTKIDPAKLPAALLKPTYKIESSHGNEQWGYVLEKPVTDINMANSLVQAMALAGFTDAGGVMAPKVVRLPAGINGKPTPDKRDYEVHLNGELGDLWDAAELFNAIELNIDGETVTWDMLQRQEVTILEKKYGGKFLPLRPISQAITGQIDPVLEWLYTNNKVAADGGGDWVTIECPNAANHSEGGGSTAGYVPLGRGDDPHGRGFHCFHENCKHIDTRWFIEWVLSNSDITCIPVIDHSGSMHTDYAFDAVNNRVWNIGAAHGLSLNIDGFKTKFNQSMTLWKIGKKGVLETMQMTLAQYWLKSPYRIDVCGAKHDATADRMVLDSEGSLWVNTYKRPQWGDGPYDMEQVEPFKQHIEYLLPADDEREYFLDWLALKTQDPFFRGTGIIMVAESFGVGRSTLGEVLTQLLTPQNCTTIPYEKLIGQSEYNVWEDKQLVIIPESRDTTTDARNGYKAYEALKQRVDTTVGRTVLNVKYQPHKDVSVTSSFLILTNHVNAAIIPEDDRRLTVLSNPDRPKPPAYYAKLHQWLNTRDKFGNPVWAPHVWRWLRQRKVEDPARLALPLNTALKRDMVDAGMSGPSRVMAAICIALDEQGHSMFGVSMVRHLFDKLIVTLRDPRAGDYSEAFIRNVMNDFSFAFTGWRVRIDDKTRDRVRVTKTGVKNGLTPPIPAGARSRPAQQLPAELVTFGENSLRTVNPDVIERKARELLQDH